MRAIDTNVTVRFITRDDPIQSPRARAVLLTGDIFLPTTVALETEWVLRGVFKFDSTECADALEKLAGLPGLTVEAPEALAQALEWLRAGMDFADAMHLATCDGCTAMLSFDSDFAKNAKRLGTMAVIAP